MKKKIGTIFLCILAITMNAIVGFAKSADESANEQKATAVLQSLETADPSAIKKWVNPNQYIQHDLAFPNGRNAILNSLDLLKKSGTKVNIKRVLSDGNFVVVQTEYNLFGPKAGFDIFRFEDGKIVEHWDNLQSVAGPNPSGHSMFDGTTKITDLDKTDANKALVKDFVESILINGQMEKLTSYFNGDNYIQHNPNIGDGLSGLGTALGEMAKQGITMKYDKIHMVLGQGNFALVVSEGSFAGKNTAYYDLFRVENGKIAEHWDVMESIMAAGERKNANGKFDKAEEDIAQIRNVINTYAKSIADADVNLAATIWQTDENTSFIHPRGNENGWEAIKNDFYIKLMGSRFSHRELDVHDIKIQVYGDTAVAEFYWDFPAIFNDGTSVTTHGRESQVYVRTQNGWKIVHVHYSHMPETGEKQGF